VRRTGGGREGPATEIALDLPSALGYVGEAVELVAAQCHPGPLSRRRVQFNLRTALAEALSNAIAYGNHYDPRKFVRVRVHLTADMVTINVMDDGDGFDPALVPDPTTPDNLEREVGRGLFVLRHLVDHVSFNEKGNAVCLTLRAG
jgi:serine/threonine-protein kinase RsbW